MPQRQDTAILTNALLDCPQVSFFVDPYRFEFRARGPLYFPQGKALNIIRGALGTELRKVACPPTCADISSCALPETCPYRRIFAPTRSGTSLSGFKDPPRPFVLRSEALDGRRLETGATFHVDIHGFDPRWPWLHPMREALGRLGADGLGSGRTKVDLLRVIRPPGVEGSLSLDVATPQNPEPVDRIRIVFLTPTGLKGDGAVIREPHFPILITRLRDRLSALSTFFQDHELPLDYKGIADRAKSVDMINSRLDHHRAERFSVAAQGRHLLAGFTGEAEYQGELAQFLPLLRAGFWTGVGRQTVWGHGAIQVERI